MYKRENSWVSDFFHEGKRYMRSWGKISKTAASEKDQKFQVEVREGKHQEKARRISFKALAEKYLAVAIVDKRPSSYRRNKTSVDALLPCFGRRPIRKITREEVEDYKRDRISQGKAPATVNREVSTMKTMLTWAVEEKYLPVNPLSGVKMLEERNERMWILSHDDEDRLLAACDKSPQRKGGKYLGDLVRFALYSGMRLQETFGLRKDDVHLEERYILVRDTKNRENRRVPVNNTLMEVIRRRLAYQESDYLFSNRDGKKLTVLTNAFWFAVKEAGLVRQEIIRGKEVTTRFRFHDLRHTAGSRLGMAGVDLKSIMDILGHRTTRMVIRYQHPAPDHKLNAVRTLDRVPSKVPSSGNNVIYIQK